MYADINYLELLKFKGCDDCVECCKKPMAPLILEDFKKVYSHFPILIARLDYLKPVMLISNGISCPYLLTNGRCSIYEIRPPACKIYPYSPWYDSILLDLSCNAVSTEGKTLPLNSKDFYLSDFYDERFNNIEKKLKKTYIWVLEQKLKFFTEYKGIKLYTLNTNSDNEYNIFQKKSLIHLAKYFKKD